MPASDREQAYECTIPANTPRGAPVELDISFAPGVVLVIEVVFPVGPSGLVGIALAQAHQPVLPRNKGAWWIGDGEAVKRDVTGYNDSGDWQLVGFNEDIIEHTVLVRFAVAEIALPAGKAPEPEGVELTASGEVAGLPPTEVPPVAVEAPAEAPTEPTAPAPEGEEPPPAEPPAEGGEPEPPAEPPAEGGAVEPPAEGAAPAIEAEPAPGGEPGAAPAATAGARITLGGVRGKIRALPGWFTSYRPTVTPFADYVVFTGSGGRHVNAPGDGVLVHVGRGPVAPLHAEGTWGVFRITSGAWAGHEYAVLGAGPTVAVGHAFKSGAVIAAVRGSRGGELAVWSHGALVKGGGATIEGIVHDIEAHAGKRKPAHHKGRKGKAGKGKRRPAHRKNAHIRHGTVRGEHRRPAGAAGHRGAGHAHRARAARTERHSAQPARRSYRGSTRRAPAPARRAARPVERHVATRRAPAPAPARRTRRR